MHCICKANYVDVRVNPSKTDGKVYTSLIVIDDDNKTFEISVPDEVLPEFNAVKSFIRFQPIEFEMYYRAGTARDGKQYSRLILKKIIMPAGK